MSRVRDQYLSQVSQGIPSLTTLEITPLVFTRVLFTHGYISSFRKPVETDIILNTYTTYFGNPFLKIKCSVKIMLEASFPLKKIMFMSITNLNMEEMRHKIPIYVHK